MTGSSYAAALRDLPPGAADLARHAAVPVVVDAGFLNLLRVNFFVDPPFVLPYEVEAELLLSPLFREVGEGLYEIDPEWRNTLLTELVAQFGTDRLGRVAGLLEQYTDHAVAWHAMPELENAQRLTALSLLDPPRAQEWLEREKAEATNVATPLASVWFVAMENRLREHQEVLESAADPMRSPQVWPTLFFTGSEHADRFMPQVLDRLGPGCESLYDSGFEVAVHVPDYARAAAMLGELESLARQADPDADVRVQLREFDFRPYLLQTLHVTGPDTQPFIVERAPATTPVRDISRAVLDTYRTEGQDDRRSRLRRTVVDMVVPPGGGEPGDTNRLSPDQTLHEAGVEEGAQLRIGVWATAGGPPRWLLPNFGEFADELAARFDQKSDAYALLETIGYSPPYRPVWAHFTSPVAFWEEVANNLENGDIGAEGAKRLAEAALRHYPANVVFQAAVRVPEPLKEGPPVSRWKRLVTPFRRTGAETNRARPPGGVWPTLLFNGSGQHDAIMPLVQEHLGPEPWRLYATATETAVWVPDRDLVAGLMDELTVPGMVVRFQEFGFEPYLIQTLTILGPDQRAFTLHDIPATTPVNDIPRMISDRYAAEVWEEYFGGYQIAVEHLESNRFLRLDPAQTLHEAGLETGDQLRLQSDLTPADTAARYYQLGVLARDRGDSEEAERRFQQCLVLQEQLGDRRGAAITHQQLGLLAQGRGDYVEAERRHHQALSVFHEWGDHAGAAASYYQLGVVMLGRGDTLESERWHQQALSLFEESGDRHRVADSHYQLGILAQKKGDLVEAERRHQQALTIEMELGEQAGAAASYHQLGVLARTRNDYGEAEHRQQQALSVFAELGIQDGVAASYHQLAMIAQDQGRYGEAEHRHQQALTIYEDLVNRVGVATTISELGNLRLATGDLAQAVVLHCQALTIRRDLGLSPASYDLAPLLELRRLLGEEAFTNLASPRLGTLALRELKALLDRA